MKASKTIKRRQSSRTWPRGAWTPVWRGALYCSPACGGGCLRSEYNRAVKAAAELAERLGPGWQPRVSENLRWHYEAISPCGRIQVSPCTHSRRSGRVVTWMAFFGESGNGGKWYAHGRTAHAAILGVIAKGLQELRATSALFRGLEIP